MLRIAVLLLALPSVARGAGLVDNPIAASGGQIYLDGKDWTLTSSPLPPPPPPVPPPSQKCAQACCFQPGVDWKPASGVISGKHVWAKNQKACCSKCAATAGCYVAVLTGVQCWLKTAEDCAGGSYKSTKKGVVSCMPKSKPPLPPGPPPPAPPAPPPQQKITGTVPGDLISDLYNAGLIGDPLFENNFRTNTSMWAGSVWTYSKSFTAPPGVSWLIFDGVKMGAKVSIDGVNVLNITDQFRRPGVVVKAGAHKLEVAFDPRMKVGGRFMSCTGGWDWAPYTTTWEGGGNAQVSPQHPSGGTPTFSSGIWKSVYVVNVAPPGKPAVAITHFVPTVFYDGAYPLEPLSDGSHGGFTVKAKLHLASAATAPVKVPIAITGEWGGSNSTTVTMQPGESVVTLTLKATAAQVKLWWPAGHGAAPLYNITATVAGAVTSSRRIGFRHFALVTGNDTAPGYVAAATGKEGNTLNFGMFFRINGAAIFSKGANMIPMEELEGRMSADAHTVLVESAVAGGMNTLRIWGGGMFLPDAFYDACDANGIMVYHDMQYAQGGHSPANTTDQDSELRHIIRRLASHTSIVIWDGCNECRVLMNTDTAIYATFVLTVVAQEDQSRTIWPSCPAAGWTSGVDRLTSRPTGGALITCKDGRSQIETHGPYQHGTGFAASNDASGKMLLFPANLPVAITPAATGVTVPNTFASEFGCIAMSSFESMSALLKPEHWGLHAGMKQDTCAGKQCFGGNPMSQRNYPCDNLISVFFGLTAGELEKVGKFAFQKQLYQCMISQALNIKSNIEKRRSKNEFGIIVWQYNEIWPTGGWGSIEYGTPVPGQLIGGRWKPLQYWYKQSIYADVFATCGQAGGQAGDQPQPNSAIQCYVKNDSPLPFNGTVTITKIDLMSGKETVIPNTFSGSMAAGSGVTEFFSVAGTVSAATEVLRVVTATAAAPKVPLCNNVLLWAPPKALKLPPATVTAKVRAAASQAGRTSAPANVAIEVTLSKGATALYVTLTSAAPGRFSDNAFLMTAAMSPLKIEFVPFQPATKDAAMVALLTKSLRVEHVALYSSE